MTFENKTQVTLLNKRNEATFEDETFEKLKFGQKTTEKKTLNL